MIALLLTACTPSGTPAILVEPASLQFRVLQVGEEETRSVVVRNPGDGPLRVTDLHVEPADGAFRLDGPSTLTVAPGAWDEIDVTFSPRLHRHTGTLTITAADLDHPESGVALEGFGYLPSLEVRPPAHDFGDVALPCSTSTAVTLANRGSAPLTITELAHQADPGLTLTLSPPHDALPITLEASESTDLTITFEPVAVGAVGGTLQITSNHPEPAPIVTQQGAGIYAAEITDTFEGPPLPRTDLLVLVDQSCSMQEDNTPDLTAGAPALFDALNASYDWQLALVTEADGCARFGVADPGTPTPATQLVDQAFGAEVPEFVTEALLGLAGTALAQTGAGACNEGLVRSGSLLHVLTISDEPEQSGIDAKDHLLAMGAYVADPSLLRVSIVADLYSQCGLGPFKGPDGYAEAAFTTGGSLLDICGDWGDGLAGVVDAALASAPGGYALSRVPLPDTLEVTVQGLAAAFTYDPVSNTIDLDVPAKLGESVEVRYAATGTCEDASAEAATGR